MHILAAEVKYSWYSNTMLSVLNPWSFALLIGGKTWQGSMYQTCLSFKNSEEFGPFFPIYSSIALYFMSLQLLQEIRMTLYADYC